VGGSCKFSKGKEGGGPPHAYCPTEYFPAKLRVAFSSLERKRLFFNCEVGQGNGRGKNPHLQMANQEG